jgi:molybdopterin/thiamine biosynthesis adenylyltransferase/molybdopterin synthase catalytic subunit/rhodanese-related sulfurtransferase
MSFRLSPTAIDCDALRDGLRDVRAGAIATFEGRVRDHNDGRAVTLLEYEAYDALAVKEGERIVAEARAKFDVYDCVCVHRTGALQLGEVAVWVGASAAHRDAAFAATRFVIDEIKSRVPIWKKETYADGDSGWVNCAGHVHSSTDTSDWFSRQTILSEIGAEGQRKLQAARVLVVRAGGLGCPALLYLAAAGVGAIGVCDGDVVEVSNLHRQVLFGAEDVGSKKASAATTKLEQQYPLTKFTAHDRRFAAAMLAKYDVVLDCTDNFATKFALSDECRNARKDLIQASVYQFEGQLTGSFADGSGQCLRCLWPETPEAGCVGSCTESGIIGATVGVFGSLQAMEAIKVICGIPSELRTHVVFFDLMSLATRRVKVKVDKSCGTASAETPREADDYSLDALSMSTSEFRTYELVDIRELDEDPSRLIGSLLRREVRSIPLSTIDVNNPGLDSTRQYLFICARGGRSDRLVAQLRAHGFTNTYSLAGGLEALRRKFIA